MNDNHFLAQPIVTFRGPFLSIDILLHNIHTCVDGLSEDTTILICSLRLKTGNLELEDLYHLFTGLRTITEYAKGWGIRITVLIDSTDMDVG